MKGPISDPELLLDSVLEKDSRYARDAYYFVQRALHHYRERHRAGKEGGHIRGEELLEGVRELGVEEFGPMARLVFHNWGLKRGEDVGEMVYNMIDAGLMSKTSEDTREDFAVGMEFGAGLDDESCW
jgi:uncharacterized repeat protein (TIGR04138 family)